MAGLSPPHARVFSKTDQFVSGPPEFWNTEMAVPTRKRRGGGKEREGATEEEGVVTARGKGGRREEEGGLVGDFDDDFFAFAVVGGAFPVLVFCFLELLAGFFFVIVAFVAAADEGLPPRRAAGAFLLLVRFFETDAIGNDDEDVFFFFETVGAVFAFAPAAAFSPDERMLRAIFGKTERKEETGFKRKLVLSLQRCSISEGMKNEKQRLSTPTLQFFSIPLCRVPFFPFLSLSFNLV